MEKTKIALKTVITGESEAVVRYGKFAKVAAHQNLPNISLLFKALATAEGIHIRNHLQALGEEFSPNLEEEEISNSTLVNISQAIEGETEENKKLYPSLIKSMKKESHKFYGKVAKLSMSWAAKAEKIHAKHLKKALKALTNGEDMVFDMIFVCEVCGNVVFDNEASKECSVCGHDILFFKREKVS